MTTKIFPITGPSREPLLILEWLIVFLFLELAIIFWMRIKSEKVHRLKILQEKAYSWLLLGYSIMWVFIIIGDYYLVNPYLRTFFLNLGYVLLIICTFIFIYIMEKYKIFLRKFLFTKIFLIIIVIYMGFFFIALNYAAIVSTTFWIVFIIFFSIYLKEIYSDFYIKRELGNLKIEFFKLCFGIFLIAIGYQLTTRLIAEIFGLYIRFIGDIFQIIGLISLSLYFISIPSFSEYDWQEKIDKILIMHKSGRLIYQKDFREQEKEYDDSIISGTITILKMMLEKVVEEEVKSVIEKKGKVVIIQPGEYIIGAIICDEKLNSIQILLNKFIEKIETVFSHILANWDGNLNVSGLIEEISKEIFY